MWGCRLSLLWLEVQKDFEQFSYYLQDADGVRQRQRGVFRTNCIDCLDRTNVVQGLLARHHLESVLHRLRILPAGQNLPGYFPGVSLIVNWLPPAQQPCSCGHAALLAALLPPPPFLRFCSTSISILPALV